MESSLIFAIATDRMILVKPMIQLFLREGSIFHRARRHRKNLHFSNCRCDRSSTRANCSAQTNSCVLRNVVALQASGLIDAPLNSLVHECSTGQQDSFEGGIGTVDWNLYATGGGRGSAHLPEIFELLILWFHGFTDEDTQLLMIELMWRMRLTKKSLAKALPGVSDFPKLVTGIQSAEVKKVQNPNHRSVLLC